MDDSRNGRGMEVVFSVCFVCDLAAVSQFFFSYFSVPQLFASHLRAAVYPHICIYSTYLETSHSRKFNYSECRISRSVVDFVTAKIVTGSVNLIQTNSPHMFCPEVPSQMNILKRTSVIKLVRKKIQQPC